MAETVRPQGFPQFLPLSGLDYIREPTRKDRLSPTKYTEKNYVKVLYVFLKMILFSDETSEVVKVAVAVVMVVVAGSVRVTHSSRHSPCSCQSQSTTKSGTVKKGGLEEEKERRSGRRVLDMN